MKQITDYLNLAKEKYGSDYKTAQLMQCDRTVISAIRKRNRLDDENAVKLAKILEIEGAEILISAAIARSNGEVKTEWEKLAKKAGIVINLMITLSGGMSEEFYNKNNEIEKALITNNIHYAKF